MICRLLIVDDEPYTADALADLFSCLDDLELEVSRAYDATQALEILYGRRIDVVLSDVKMPGMDGLQLQREIRRRWPRCKIVFLSAHDDFAFVQSVMRHEGFDYILKTEPDDVIISAVRRAIAVIRSEAVQERLIERARHQIETALPILRREYGLRLLRGTEAPTEQPLRELGIGIRPEEPVLLLHLRIDRWGGEDERIEPLQRAVRLQPTVLRVFEERFAVDPIEIDERRVVFLLQRPSHLCIDLDELILFARESLDAVQYDCERAYQEIVSLVLSPAFVSMSEIAQEHRKLTNRLDRGSGLEPGVIIDATCDWEAEEEEIGGLHEAVSRRLERISWLEAALETGEEERFFREIDGLLCFFRDHVPFASDLSVQGYATLASFLLAYLNRVHLYRRLSRKVDLSLLVNIRRFVSWSEISEYVTTLAQAIFAVHAEERRSTAHRLVRQIDAYIDKHMSEDISLTRLADAVGLNRSYLSRHFKQTTGICLSAHIDEARIARAKELLRASNLRVADITRVVGFSNPSYFIKFFRKHIGVTPQAYRDEIVDY